MSLVIKNGRVVDPANDVDKKEDVLVEDGKIVRLGADISSKGATIIDASGKVVIPGLIDMHAHFRQPGREDEETIRSGSLAAIRGGFTSVCIMPNTTPALDTSCAVEFIKSEAENVGLINIYIIGAITKNREGKTLTEFGDLKRVGVVALSDDGDSIENPLVMRKALEYAKMYELLLIVHCEDKKFASQGVVNEGYVSTILGLAGIPNISESNIVKRDIELAKYTSSKIHIAHVSTLESVDIIRNFRKDSVRLSCETCPHYFTLTDEAVYGYETNAKVNPPLRSRDDVEEIKRGLKDGTIDVIATDHAPHTDYEKDYEFDKAPFGMIGLETAFSLAFTELVAKSVLSLSELVEKMSFNPARILGLPVGTLSKGSVADIMIFDPKKEWEVKREDFLSKSKNSPFVGWRLKGVVEYTVCKGRVVFSKSQITNHKSQSNPNAK